MGKGRSKVDMESVFCFGFMSIEGSFEVFCLLLGSKGSSGSCIAQQGSGVLLGMWLSFEDLKGWVAILCWVVQLIIVLGLKGVYQQMGTLLSPMGDGVKLMVYAILPELDDFSGAASLVPRLCTGVEVHLPQHHGREWVLRMGTMGYFDFLFVLSLVFDYLPERGVPGLVLLEYFCLLTS